jgi:cytochrome oxidase Cu insertion factor (SCO1/SenC/PrrC family)
MKISELGSFLDHETKRRVKMKTIGFVLVVITLLVGCASNGQSPRVSPEVGDYAPDFSIVDVSGNAVRLSDFKGNKNVVLFFYFNGK